MVGGEGEGAHQAGADGGGDGRDDHPVREVAEFARADARYDRRKCDAQHRRQVHDPRVHRRRALDRLEPDGQQVHDRDHPSAAEERVDDARRHGPNLDDPRRHRRKLLSPYLHADEGDEEHARKHEKRDDPSVRPCVVNAAPLQRQEEAGDGRDEDCCADGV